jgi:hypothetical protein
MLPPLCVEILSQHWRLRHQRNVICFVDAKANAHPCVVIPPLIILPPLCLCFHSTKLSIIRPPVYTLYLDWAHPSPRQHLLRLCLFIDLPHLPHLPLSLFCHSTSLVYSSSYCHFSERALSGRFFPPQHLRFLHLKLLQMLS